MKYVPIDEYVTIKNGVYKCVKYDESYGYGCPVCDLRDTKHCGNMNCTKGMRDDFTEAMFTLFDNNSEDENEGL